MRKLPIWLLLLILVVLSVPWLAGPLKVVMSNNNVFWYVSRATGLGAYFVLWLNMAFGLAIQRSPRDGTLPRWRVYDLHQFTAPVALGLLALHIFSLLGDHYIGFTVSQLLVPMQSSYRPFQVALGIIGLYLLLLITLSSYVQRRIGHKTWRAIHYLSILAYLMALYHAVLSGTDSGRPWAIGVYLVSVLALMYLGVRRFLAEGGRKGGAARLVRETNRLSM